MKRSRVNAISKARQRELEYRKPVEDYVKLRDQGCCVWCDAGGCHVHEIVPRSRFGHKTMTQCYQSKNMCVLCLACHEKAQNPAARRELIGIMTERYGYDYSDGKWREYALAPENETVGGS